MKARWFALLMVPAALAFGFAQDADAGGYGNKHGYYGQSQSHGYSHAGYRKHGYAPAYRHHNRSYYRPGYRSEYRGYGKGYRKGYREGYRHGYRSYSPVYRHGYRKGRHHGHSRSHRSYWPRHYRGGITLHFGY